MRVAIVGYGSIGKRHAGILCEHFDIEPWIVRRGEGIPRCDVACICTPTENHIERAIEAAEKCGALFIEKPLSNSMDGYQELSRLVSIRSLPTYVGYVLRHDGFIRDNRERIKSITCFTNSTKWPSKRKLNHLLLELSHEIDIAAWVEGGWLAGEMIGEHEFVGSMGNIKLHLKMRSTFDVREYSTGLYGYTPVVNDELYRKQWEWFFENMHFGMMNNIREARPTLEQIVRFIDGNV